jgi:hypothetical protein
MAKHTTVLNSSICSFRVAVALIGQSGRVSNIHWMICMVGAEVMANVWSLRLLRSVDVSFPGLYRR